MNNYDAVTLLQLEAGTRMLKCAFTSDGKTYYYKSPRSMKPNSYALVYFPARTHQYSTVRVLADVTDDFLPEAGVEYKWVAGLVETSGFIENYNDMDRIARKKLQLAAAIGEARASANLATSGLRIPGVNARENEDAKWERRATEMPVAHEATNPDLLGDSEVPF